MLKRKLIIILCLAPLAAACIGRSERATDQAADANQPAANANAGLSGAFDMTKLDAEINRLEAQAAQEPDDRSVRDAAADAYTRRGAAHYAAHKLEEAVRDYERALNYDPTNEEAQLRITQINQERGDGLRTDDGKPATVTGKPGASNSNQ